MYLRLRSFLEFPWTLPPCGLPCYHHVGCPAALSLRMGRTPQHSFEILRSLQERQKYPLHPFSALEFLFLQTVYTEFLQPSSKYQGVLISQMVVLAQAVVSMETKCHAYSRTVHPAFVTSCHILDQILSLENMVSAAMIFSSQRKRLGFSVRQT